MTCLKARVLGGLLASVCIAGTGSVQASPVGVPFAAGFQPGGQQLFALDLSGTPIGEIPTSIRLPKGTLEVVLKDGVPMLKASARSEFLITLPPGQLLPQDFTLEFDPAAQHRIGPGAHDQPDAPSVHQTGLTFVLAARRYLVLR